MPYEDAPGPQMELEIQLNTAFTIFGILYFQHWCCPSRKRRPLYNDPMAHGQKTLLTKLTQRFSTRSDQ